jgi:hypothetical protein
LILAAALAPALTAASANAGVIVAENFGGNGSGGLAGTAADRFSPLITAAGGSAIWVANSGFKDNGLISNVSRKAACLDLGSYVNNAKGTDRGLFTLTMTVSETSGTWLSLGFGQENTPSTDKDFTNASSVNPAPAQTTTGLGTIIYRAQGGTTLGELDMFGGPGSATGVVDGPEPNTGNRTLTVTLDLTPAGGTHGRVTWSDSVRGVLGSYTYTTSRNFGSILISGSATGTISNLSLSQTGVSGPCYAPDPADGATRVATDLSGRTVPGAVSWSSPDSPDDPDIVQVFGYNVYMDTDRTKVANASPASANLLHKSLQSGGQTGTSFAPGAGFSYNTTYYWRVDAVVDEAFVAGTTLATATTIAGNVWSFTTMAPVDSPTPGSGETNAALSSMLSWQTPVGGNLTYDVYFGTDLNAVTRAGRVDYQGLSRFAGEWMDAGDLESDRNNDGKVDFADFALFASQPASPEFKGNQTGTAFNPVGLQERTTYYWRVDAVDASNNVYKGSVWSFSTYDTLVMRQQMLAKYDNEGVPYVLNNQKLPGYNPTGDPNDILAGQINSTDLDPLANSFNQRNVGAIYPLAFCYVNPNSVYYRNAEVLNRILLALDYSCRAQGGNGGFNEKIDTQNGQYGWCGVALPNGGNNTRTDGASTVMGFPFFCIGRSIVMLQNEPAFISALDTVFIDNDGNGSKDVLRRDAYKFMFNNSINGGSQTGIIQCMINGKCKGGHPNQDVGALAAIQACNEAYQFLNNGTPYLTPAQLNSHRDTVLFDNASLLERLFNPNRRNWWTDKFMILEVGHGASGYDTGYANTVPSLLGSYARHTGDPVVGNFITSFMNGYQYFFVLDDAWDDGGYWEYRTSRRQGDNRMPVFSAGTSQPYHPGYALIYDKALAKFAKNPALFLNVPWSGGLESSAFGELLDNWSDPVDSDYVLPCNRPETFVYTDSEANLEVRKTGAGPETVTWKAFNWDGGTMTYTYEPPAP